MIVHFCHVACSMDGFRVRLRLGRESGPGAFNCVMLCGYFDTSVGIILRFRMGGEITVWEEETMKFPCMHMMYEHPGVGICPEGRCRGGGSCLGDNCPGG